MINKFLIFIFFLLGSCSYSSFDKKEIAEIATSSVGGYLGYQWSDGDIPTTVIGSSLGLLLGGYIGEYLAKNDYYYYKTSLIETLENNQLGATGYWKNIKSGNEGVILVKNYYGDPECRLIEHRYIVRNSTNSFYDTACRLESGAWTLIR